MKEIVINRCYGGFGLSHKAIMRYAELSGFKLYCYTDKRDINDNLNRGLRKCNPEKEECFFVYYYKKDLKENELNGKTNINLDDFYFYDRDLERDDKILVKVVKELGKDANGRHAKLGVVNIPNNVEWILEEYDGIEWVAEKHRTWE